MLRLARRAPLTLVRPVRLFGAHSVAVRAAPACVQGARCYAGGVGKASGDKDVEDQGKPKEAEAGELYVPEQAILNWPVEASNRVFNTVPEHEQWLIERGMGGKDSFSRIVVGEAKFTGLPLLDRISFAIDTRVLKMDVPSWFPGARPLLTADKASLEFDSSVHLQFVDGPGAAADETQRAVYRAAYGRTEPFVSLDKQGTYNPYMAIILAQRDAISLALQKLQADSLQGDAALMEDFAAEARDAMAKAVEPWGLEVRGYTIDADSVQLTMGGDDDEELSLEATMEQYLKAHAANPAVIAAEQAAEKKLTLAAEAAAQAALAGIIKPPMLGDGPGVLGSKILAPASVAAAADATEAPPTTYIGSKIAAAAATATEAPAAAEEGEEAAPVVSAAEEEEEEEARQPVVARVFEAVEGPPADPSDAAVEGLLQNAAKLQGILESFEEDDNPELVTVDELLTATEMMGIPVTAELDTLIGRYAVVDEDENRVRYRELLAEVAEVSQ